MAGKILKIGLMVYLLLMAVGVLVAISTLDFHGYQEGVVGLVSVFGLIVTAAYRQLA
jgi:hypothetical protein